MIDLSEKNLPNTVEVNGRFFPLKTDFRVWLKFGQELMKEDFDPSIVLATQEEISYQLFIKLTEFYFNQNKYPICSSTGKTVLDYFDDSEYIYAEFLEKYGVDLLTDNLHWHKFQALFRGLLVKFSEIVGYRCYEGKDTQQNQIKARWAIQSTRSRDSTANEIEKILMQDGDFSRLGGE